MADQTTPPQSHTTARALLARFSPLGTGTLANVLDRLNINGLLSGLQSLSPRPRFVGLARTLKAIVGPKGSFTSTDFDVGVTIDGIQPADVLVFDNGGMPVSMLGGNAVLAAKLRGAVGMIVDGAIRDVDEILELEFPGYTRHVVMPAGVTRLKVIGLNVPVTAGGVEVNPGDIIVADASGVLAIPAARAEEILMLAEQIERKDQIAVKAIHDGQSFSEVLRLVRAPASSNPPSDSINHIKTA